MSNIVNVRPPRELSHGPRADASSARVGISAIFGTRPGEQDVLLPWWAGALLFFGITAGIIIYVANTTEHLR
jgi:hypothetical protein